MSSGFLYLHNSEANYIELVTLNRKNPINIPSHVKFSELLTEEEKIKKEMNEIIKNIKELRQIYVKILNSEIKYTNIFRQTNKYEYFRDISESVKNKKEEILAEYKEDAKQLSHSNQQNNNIQSNYLNKFYVVVSSKDIPGFFDFVSNFVDKKLVIEIERNKNGRTFEIFTLKQEYDKIFNIISTRYNCNKNVKTENNIYSAKLYETLVKLYDLYVECAFYLGLNESIQINGCPLEYFYLDISEDVLSQKSLRKISKKEETVTVALKTINDL